MPTRASHAAQLRVLRAIALARAGRLGAALGQVRAAQAEGGDDVLALVAGAAVCFVARDFQGAFDALDRATMVDPTWLDRIVEDRVRYATSLGWDQEVRASLELAMREQPDEARWFALATQCFVRGGALERGLAAATRALALTPDSVSLGLEVASLSTELGGDEQAVAACEAVARRIPDDAERHQLAVARILRSAGEFTGARRKLEQVLQRSPQQAGIVYELAELALWRGDLDEALEQLEHARDLDASHPAARRLQGIVEMLRGAPARAVPLFDEAIAGDPSDAPTLVWRAEAAYRLGDDDTAHELLSRATMCADGYLFVAWMVRQLVVSREGASDEVPAHRIEEFREAVCQIVPHAHDVFAKRERVSTVQVIELALTRMRGNRTTTATFVDDAGVLQRVRSRSGVRRASRQALQLIRVLPPEEVVSALDRVVRQYPEAALPVCHRGELFLWLGDLERARADLEAALRINPHTRWAYIGLSGIDILQGDPQRALETCAHGVQMMGNTEGPAVYVYRGEAYRLLGRYEEARADLEKAVAITPTRIGAWVDLALLHAQVGDDEAFERTWTHLEGVAIGLLADASREVGVAAWPPSDDDRRRVLAHALAMMRGNRSTSCPTYFTREGSLRFVQPHARPVADPRAQSMHMLDRAHALLSGLGELSRRTRASR